MDSSVKRADSSGRRRGRTQNVSSTTPTVFGVKLTLAESDARQLAAAIIDAQAGGERGFRYLYEHYADNMYSYVRTIVHDDHAAEDITQQVFMKLLVKIKGYERRAAPFEAWLLRIARNCAIDHIRRRAKTIYVDEVVKVDTPFDDTGKELREQLTDALKDLSQSQRHVLVMRHFIGMTPKEISVQIGKSEGAVHTLHHRARNRLKTELIDRDCAPSSYGLAVAQPA